MKIGIIKEGKIPVDRRVALTPLQCYHINSMTQHEVVVQSCRDRAYSDDEYASQGVSVVDNVDDCDLLLGIKEVPIAQLIRDKSYMFFSHTMKKQEHNRSLLQEILRKKITMIDYEAMTDESGKRLLAFGYFAGIVGAHNGVMTYGSRTGLFALDRMHSFEHYSDAKAVYNQTTWPDLRVVLTGSGRVGNGAECVLSDMGFVQLEPAEYLKASSEGPVFTRLSSSDYICHPDGRPFSKKEFYQDPGKFEADFLKYARVSDLMINGIYWDKNAPAFFGLEDIKSPDFRIQVIADIACDIAPEASIPCTVRPSTIEEPVYGFDKNSLQEVDPFMPGAIDIMAVDNLPSELPRDASRAFGSRFIETILPELDKQSEMLQRATIARDGRLTVVFSYLEDYVNETADTEIPAS